VPCRFCSQGRRKKGEKEDEIYLSVCLFLVAAFPFSPSREIRNVVLPDEQARCKSWKEADEKRCKVVGFMMLSVWSSEVVLVAQDLSSKKQPAAPDKEIEMRRF
jgi:hypothetical protein